MAFYKSKYTGAEIDQRLAQGTYDDALMRGFDGTKEDFDILLAKLKKTSDLAFGSQQYEDDRLETINKTVVDAINELHTVSQSKPDKDEIAAKYATKGELEEESNSLDSKITTVNNNLVESVNTINKNVNDSLIIVNQAVQQNAETIVAEIEQRKEADTELSERVETLENAGYATKEELNDYALKSELPKQYIVEEGAALQAGDEQHEFNIKSSGRVTVNSANEVVTYTPYPGEEGRKMLVLANNDSLTGTKTDGTGAPLAFMSKWDKIEIGNSTTSLNLNSTNGEITVNDDKILATVDQIQVPYEINLTNLLSSEDSESISAAIGGIDKLNATVQDNRIIVGTISNGSVSVSIRILGNVTTLYYLLDSVVGLTLNEIAITNTSGTLSKSITTHSVLTENMVINSLNSDETTLPLSAAQGKVLQEVINSKQDIITAGTGLEFEGTTLNVTLDTTVFKVVSVLPDSPAQGDENKIHLVPAESTGANNAYTEYIWVNSAWEILGEYTSEVDLTPYLKIETAEATYATKSELQEVQNNVNGKQDTLVSGQNIKSIDGESLLGEGDIQIKYPFPSDEPKTSSYFIDADNYDPSKFDQDIKKGVDIIRYQSNYYQIYQAYWADHYWWVYARDLVNPNLQLKFELNQFSVVTTKFLQTSTDNTLQTTNKTVPGAINEINDKLPVYTIVPELTADYTIPANATTREFIYEISIGATTHNIIAAEGIKWIDNNLPLVEANSKLIVSVVNNIAVWGTVYE